jgi:predicted GNAT family N-acyltransferase
MSLTARFIEATETHSLRYRVLWPHLPSVDVCVIEIDNRDDAFHVGVFSGDVLISVGSFFQLVSPRLQYSKQYRLRAMATDPNYRRMHAGECLIDFACIELRKRRVDVLWCDARLMAVPFYESIGFYKFEDVYEVPLIGPHHFMWKEL